MMPKRSNLVDLVEEIDKRISERRERKTVQTWPIPARYTNNVDEKLVEKFYKKIKKLSSKGFSKGKIASLFRYPTQMWEIVFNIWSGSKKLFDWEKRKDFCANYLDYISKVKRSDLLGDGHCPKYHNLIY